MKNFKKIITTAGVACIAASVLVVGPTSAASAATVYPESITSMGDSITRAASTNPGSTSDVTANSWSTGTGSKVNSHYNRIKAAAGAPDVSNAAKSGSKSGDLVRQAKLVAANKAEYVTILSGGNDICLASSASTMTSTATYKNNVRNALEILDSSASNPKVLLASVPSLLDLYNIGKDSPSAKRIWVGGDVCAPMLGDPDDRSVTANNRRNAVEQRVKDYNIALKEVCSEFSNCSFDDGAVYNIDLKPADISTVDYFHPSVAGQNKIADATWSKAVSKIFSKGTTSGPTKPTTPTNPPAGDNESPEIEVISPASETVSGNVAVKLSVTSDSAIKSVYIKIAGQSNIPMTKSGNYWVANINVSSYPSGTVFYTQFVATDADGDTTTTTKYKMTVGGSTNRNK